MSKVRPLSLFIQIDKECWRHDNMFSSVLNVFEAVQRWGYKMQNEGSEASIKLQIYNVDNKKVCHYFSGSTLAFNYVELLDAKSTSPVNVGGFASFLSCSPFRNEFHLPCSAWGSLTYLLFKKKPRFSNELTWIIIGANLGRLQHTGMQGQEWADYAAMQGTFVLQYAAMHRNYYCYSLPISMLLHRQICKYKPPKVKPWSCKQIVVIEYLRGPAYSLRVYTYWRQWLLNVLYTVWPLVIEEQVTVLMT